MGMTPDEFLSGFVYGNLSDFERKPYCVRRGFNAAVAASHMADHHYAYSRRRNHARFKHFRKLGDYIGCLFQHPGQSFLDVRSVANAYKHLYVKAHWSISSAGSIEAVQFDDSNGYLRSIEQDWFCSPDTASETARVVFRRRDGSRGELLPAIQAVVEFWSGELYGADD